MSSEEALDVKDVVVYGCGAIGSVLATFLQLSNKDREKTIHLVGRDYVLKPIRENGLIYKPFDENKPAIKTEGFKLYENIEDVPRTDVLFVSMKVHGLRDALKSAQHLLKSQPYVFLTMNGLGLPEIVEKFVDPVKIVECVVNYPSKLEENIVKNDGGNSNFMVKDTPNPPVKKLINALFNPGTLDIRIKPKFRINQWRKAMMNIGMNGVSAISMLTVGQVLERKTLGAIIKKLIRETLVVANKDGIEFFSDEQKAIDFFWEFAGKDPNHTTSTYQDFKKNRKTEIQFMNGYIVSKGKQLGIPTPANRAITRLVEIIENEIVEE